MTALLAACSSSGGSGARAPNSTTPRAVAVSEPANGSTVGLRVGQELEVTLHSTYWELAPPGNARVLRVSTPPTSETGAHCTSIPGTGCGTVTATYVARAAGHALVDAHRTTCGEARRCTGSEGHWRISVRVTQ
ncbi:MAG TPA: hypothetical protein VEP49_02035 [Acidimicrobiia bacterium]|nr:hypothetical protein [Acidimicrobiia bacterium]